jgi:hypothetical protein
VEGNLNKEKVRKRIVRVEGINNERRTVRNTGK